jgi:hypothetical protein
VHGAQHAPKYEIEMDEHKRKSIIVTKMPALDESGNYDESAGWDESVIEPWNQGPGQTW